MQRRKSPSFANFVTFVSRTKVQSCASLHHSEIEYVPDLVAAQAPVPDSIRKQQLIIDNQPT